MFNRRAFIAGASATACSGMLPLGASAAGAAGNESAPPRHFGLRSNTNYFICNGGKPIRDFTVEIEVTEDIVAPKGFSFQLNGWSPNGSNCTWQQYTFGFYTDNKEPGELAWSIENWPSTEYNEFLNRTIGLSFGNLYNIHGEPAAVAGPDQRVPRGYKFKIGLIVDPKDAAGTVVGAHFLVSDNGGRTVIEKRAMIADYTFWNTSVQIAPNAMAPVVALQLNVCALHGGAYGYIPSGAGEIRYSSSSALSVQDQSSPWMAYSNGFTGETANTVYGQLPAAGGWALTQTFSTMRAPAYFAGMPFAILERSGGGADLYAVSVTGQIARMKSGADGRWTDAGALGAERLARPPQTIAAIAKPGDEGLAGVFAVAQDGQLQGFWVGADHTEGPIDIGAQGFASPIAALAASPQYGQRSQTDVFVTNTNTDQLNVFWAGEAGKFHQPVKIKPENFANKQGALTAAPGAVDGQTNVFLVNSEGTVSRFYVSGGGKWQDPEKISDAGFASPGAHIAALKSGGALHIFVIGNTNHLATFTTAGSGPWSRPAYIGEPGFAGNGAPVAAVEFGDGRIGVFAVDEKGRVNAAISEASGTWSVRTAIAQLGSAFGGAYLSALRRSGSGGRVEVFFIADEHNSASGWPSMISSENGTAWSAPKKLVLEV